MPSRALHLLALLLGPAAHAAAPEVVVADAAEVQTFKQTAKRFEDRMKDFTVEARLIVDAWEASEREALRGDYSEITNELGEQDLDLRNAAIDKFEAFLSKYPDNRYTPHVMFRLGDLYFEEAEEQWILADKEFQRTMDALDPANFDDLPEEPLRDFGRSVSLYRRIVENYPEYEYIAGAYYMLGFCLSERNARQFDETEGRDMFAAIAESYPESEFAADANMRLGEYWFDQTSDVTAIDRAILHYSRVVDTGPTNRLYDEGLYKLAWSYYKKAESRTDYEQALDLLGRLLDWSEGQFQETGKEASTAPEAITYMAISFSDIADRELTSPVQEADTYFAGHADRPYEIKVYKELADVLTQQARYDEAIRTYRTLQERWPYDPDNPNFQYQIARLYVTGPLPDVEASQAAIKQLNELYNEDSAWNQENRNNPDALSQANKHIEESLATLAINLHTNGDETGNVADYIEAAGMYREYLLKFPFADDYYEIQFYLADVLTKSEQYAGAEIEYQRLLKGGKHTYRDAALWNLMQVRRKLLEGAYGKVETRPPDAVVERVVTLPSGRERPVYALDEQHKKFIEVCDELVEAEFTDKDYSNALDEFRSALAYLPAQILYEYGRYDEARPRFESIIDKWPRKNHAAFSASLIMDSYQDEENLAKVRLYGGKFAGMSLGEGDVASEKERQFADLQEGATFKLAEGYIASGDREKAAEAFVSFMAEFPNSKYIKDAHYNAANSYEIIGRVDEANRLFEQYVNDYPKDERSRALYFRIAGNYANVLELDRAIAYYENLVRYFPDFQDAPAALYNAAFLRIGLGDYESAARNFERYAREYPDQADAEQVMFQAGDQWENVSRDDAITFYRRYLKTFPDANPDHVMEAYYRVAELTEETGNPRAVEAAWDDLAAAYARFAPEGKVGPAGRHYAARAAFRKLEADLVEFKVYKFTNNDDKNAQLILEDKKVALEALVQEGLAIIQEYQDFEYSSAALYVQGDGYFSYADMIYSYPCPASFTEEMCLLFTEKLDEVRIPVEDKGRARLVANLEKAASEKLWSEWVAKSLAFLATRDPANYAADKVELRGAADSNLVPTAGALPIRVVEPETPEGAGESGETPWSGEREAPPAEGGAEEEVQP